MDYIIRDIDNALWQQCRVRAVVDKTNMKKVLHALLADYARGTHAPSTGNPRRERDLAAELARVQAIAKSIW